MIARGAGERQREIRLRDIEPGDLILVEAGGGLSWQTVRDVSGEFVSTEEEHAGYRMDRIVRHEPAGKGAAS